MFGGCEDKRGCGVNGPEGGSCGEFGRRLVERQRVRTAVNVRREAGLLCESMVFLLILRGSRPMLGQV
jgi:hypothetical protein